MLRKLDAKPLPMDFEPKIRNRKDIQCFLHEKQMIEAFVNKITMIDPDLIIAHNLTGGPFELLLSRIQYLKISHWSRIGRLKK
jgi:DNA polymerase alpha subunit A